MLSISKNIFSSSCVYFNNLFYIYGCSQHAAANYIKSGFGSYNSNILWFFTKALQNKEIVWILIFHISIKKPLASNRPSILNLTGWFRSRIHYNILQLCLKVLPAVSKQYIIFTLVKYLEFGGLVWVVGVFFFPFLPL